MKVKSTRPMLEALSNWEQSGDKTGGFVTANLLEQLDEGHAEDKVSYDTFMATLEKNRTGKNKEPKVSRSSAVWNFLTEPTENGRAYQN